MNHGLWLRNPDSVDTAQVVEWGIAAEDAGWDGVFVSDSLPFPEFPDPWVLLAGIAARTKTIRLGTWVVPVPRYHPWQLAQTVATLDNISDGRVIIGAGLGNDPDYDAFGQPYDPPALGAQMDETLDIVSGLWGSDQFTYDGEHYTLEDAKVEPKPVQQPRVPILAGCWWPNKPPFRRGARWDGIMPYFPSLTGDGTGPHGEDASGSPIEEVREALEYYRDLTDDPGDILLPTLPDETPSGYLATYEELGATWVLTTDIEGSPDEVRRQIRDGPPG